MGEIDNYEDNEESGQEGEYGDSSSVDWNNLREDRLLFVPLGGTGEIGMNFNLYHYMGKWLIVDCGAGFADDALPGVDIIIPSAEFIIERAEDVVGMIITHAHEDHIGALPHLWEKIGCPLYATRFTANFLRQKFSDKESMSAVPIHEIDGEDLDLDPFRIHFIALTHSIPEMRALAIETDEGVVLHTGDWKFDADPVIGDVSDEESLSKFGERGVLAMIGDSTNVFSRGESASEGSLYDSLHEIIKGSKGLVAASMFASNIARISMFCAVAKDVGRQVAILGKALHNVTVAAQNSGYLEGVDFLDGRELSAFDKDKMLILCTGCQGDKLAAVNRLSENQCPSVSMVEGDTIILSSKMIPGNEKRISAILNRFARSGINVVTERTHRVHVSGHPYRNEVEKMYGMVKPRIAIPVHGEHMHLVEHMLIAKHCGVPEPVLVEDGDVVCLNADQEGGRVIGRVAVGYSGIDGKILISPDSNVMHLRRRLATDGIVIVVLSVDRRLKLLKMPTVSAPGCLDNRGILQKIAHQVEEHMFANKRLTYHQVLVNVKKRIRNTVYSHCGKNPVIEVKIEQI